MTHGHFPHVFPGEYGRGSDECDPSEGGPGDRDRSTPGSADTERVASIHFATQVGMGETRGLLTGI